MKLTIAAFIQTLNAHRLLDHALPSLKLEKAYWTQFYFDDTGAHYIKPGLRNDMNYGSMMWQKLCCLRVGTSLIIERAEERFYETGKWPM